VSDTARGTILEMNAAPETIAAELRALDRLAPVIDAIGTGAGTRVYLVGGTVRDILLGRENFDVDLAIEGDSVDLAQRLAHELRGQTSAHDRFGTAVVRYGDGEHVDVVTARRETYATPAALPSVELNGTIEDDLRRRDFTINAMAASLAPGDFGRLVDPFHGRADLEGSTIRVLHERSFVDDPTRIFRAIRYENRFGFRMDPGTEALARTAVELGLVGELSQARLRDELVALLDEEHVDLTFERLAELGAAEAIHRDLAADAEAARLASRLGELKKELDAHAPDWRLRLAVLARRVPPDEIRPWLERLGLRRRDADLIAAAVTAGPRLVEQLQAAGRDIDPAEVVALAEPSSPDGPLFALALADVPLLRDYFTRLRHVRLEITGRDLAELGLGESPQVGEVLDELRRRKLRGDLDGRESELAAARELIGG
jgi:tRNA nucleotidyltransferase (CCA-adding enzyme)